MPEICPFLAASHDPDSVLNYPSAANVCTKLGEPQPVANEHQAGYCLRARHWFCPVYTGAIKQPPIPIQIEADADVTESRRPREPREVRQRQFRRIQERRLLMALLIAVLAGGSIYGATQLLAGKGQQSPTESSVADPSPETMTQVGTAAATSAISGGQSAALTMTVSEPVMPTPTLTTASGEILTPSVTMTISPTASETATITATATSSITSTATASATSTATPRACEVPFGWQRYTVSAGETYFRIAVKFGTTVDVLQRVNCLVAPERLLSGQVINVPPVPTPTK